ncbi:MAG: hypothetical protein H0T42_32925 [Deltaproteobacteria bacterium]|nr:hypothetical protein [Deltaproteobacteria bacterium]
MSDIDKQIEEFHRAGRRRKAIIYGISGGLMLALGAVILIISFTAGAGDGEDEYGGGFPVKVLVGGIAFLVGGLGSCYNAYRIGSGQVNDVEYDPGR